MSSDNLKTVSITEGDDSRRKNESASGDDLKSKTEKLKKPIIFALMAVVCLGCIYLIFKPTETKNKTSNIGLNDAVPQATDAGMQADKQKAYEHAVIEQKQQEKRNALASLSDYWNSDSIKATGNKPLEEQLMEEGIQDRDRNSSHNANPALNSYQNAQKTLHSFYQNDKSETEQLKKQIEDLQQQLSHKDTVTPNSNIESQLALMEKSYQMAAKYLPSNNGTATGSNPSSSDSTKHKMEMPAKENFVAFTPITSSVVSSLYREPSDIEFAANLSEKRNRNFFTAGVTTQLIKSKNSIRACIQETQTISGEAIVKIRLLEAAKTPAFTIPSGTVVTAQAKINTARLQLNIKAIELEGNIIPVNITVYDLDGQQGLYIPYSPEMNAITEIASNMSQTTGTSIMMTRSASQQAAGDLSRGVVQGISGYFSKKIRTPKVKLKAGHQVLLVSGK